VAITVLGMETFQWLTLPAFLPGNRWSAAVMASIGSPGPYGTGKFAHSAAGSYLDTYAWLGSGLIMVEFSIRFSAFATDDLIRLQFDGSNAVATLGITAGGQIYLIGSPGGASVLFPANMALGNWYRIQWNAKFGLGGTGHFLVRINGNPVADYTGNFSYFGDTSPVSFIRFRMGAEPGTDISNIIWGTIADPTTDWFPADQRAVCLRALADGSVAWTPNGAATNADCINEANPDSDTTYNSSAVPGDQDLFTVTPPALTGTINLLGATVISRKDDASPVFISPSIRTNGTTVQGTSIGQGASYQGNTTPWQINPVTGVPFTPAEIDAIQFGYLNAT
jgi:hypothetical protein